MSLLFPVRAEAATTISECEIGTQDGYDYELWKDSGTTSMVLKDAGSFSCEWSDINNALFRKGKKFKEGEQKPYDEMGTITIDYGCDYNPDGNSYLCVYGWSLDPLIEYYIVDSWGSWRPVQGKLKGTIEADGGTYEVYEAERVEQPSIQGTTTFKQYWSVRTEKKTAGTISVSEHFKAWEKLGLHLGSLYEVSLNVEGWQSSGSADVYKNVLSIRSLEDEIAAANILENGDFENGTEGWLPYGESTIAEDTDSYYSGKKSVKISNRKNSYDGICQDITGKVEAGGIYRTSAWINTESEVEDASMNICIYFGEQYTENAIKWLATGNAEKDNWTKITGEFTIPEDVDLSKVRIYVEGSDTADFYVDDIMMWKAGTTETDTDSKPGGTTNPDTESKPGTVPDPDTESGMGTVTNPDTDSKTDTGTKPDAGSQTGTAGESRVTDNVTATVQTALKEGAVYASGNYRYRITSQKKKTVAVVSARSQRQLQSEIP